MLKTLFSRYPFHPLIYFILVETMLSRVAFFAAMPFVAIQMQQASGSSPAFIGAILGAGPLVAIFVGFYVSYLSDFLGRRLIIVLATSLWVFIFWGFSLATTALEFGLLMGLNGLARGIFEPVTAALVSDLSTRPQDPPHLQKMAYQLRYYMINVGASVGPLVGAGLVLTRPGFGFRVAAVIYLISTVLFFILSQRWGVHEFEKQQKKPDHNFSQVLQVLWKDRALQILIFAFVLIGIANSQHDSNLTLYLKEKFGNAGVTLFGQLLAFNGFGVVVMTIPLLYWAKRFNVYSACAVSAVVWAVGFFLLAIAEQPWEFFGAMFILTVGEIVVFSNGYYLIDSMAPREMKGAYMGASNMGQTGMIVGPMFGGMMLGNGGGLMLFSSMAALMLISAGLYILSGWYRKI